jgi:hypothetical protein
VGLSFTEATLVKALGYVIFLLAFIPLIFGGTIYRMLEKVMAAKLVITLVYLLFVAVFMVSATTAKEVAEGLVSFGQVPLRADTVIAGRHFQLAEQHGDSTMTVKGTVETSGPLVTAFVIADAHSSRTYNAKNLGELTDEQKALRSEMAERAAKLAVPGQFHVESFKGSDIGLKMEGRILEDRTWEAERFTVIDDKGTHDYARIEDISAPAADRFRALIENKGLERTQITGYVMKHGRLPKLDWAMIATLAAIAGAGGMTNVLFSNFAREKGWGMVRVGPFPAPWEGGSLRCRTWEWSSR